MGVGGTEWRADEVDGSDEPDEGGKQIGWMYSLPRFWWLVTERTTGIKFGSEDGTAENERTGIRRRPWTTRNRTGQDQAQLPNRQDGLDPVSPRRTCRHNRVLQFPVPGVQRCQHARAGGISRQVLPPNLLSAGSAAPGVSISHQTLQLSATAKLSVEEMETGVEVDLVQLGHFTSTMIIKSGLIGSVKPSSSP